MPVISLRQLRDLLEDSKVIVEKVLAEVELAELTGADDNQFARISWWTTVHKARVLNVIYLDEGNNRGKVTSNANGVVTVVDDEGDEINLLLLQPVDFESYFRRTEGEP